MKQYNCGELSKKKSLKSLIKKSDIIKNWRTYLLTVPAIVLFFIFTYMAAPGMLLAFKKYTVTGGIFGSEWVGFENFKSFFNNPYFYSTVRNTVVINLVNLVFSTVLTIFFAIIMNELFSNVAKKIYQNVLFLPTFFSVLLVAKFLTLLFSNNGIINGILQSMGFDMVLFYQEPKYWLGILIGTYLWKGVGYSLIVYLATISGIDKEMYEAAYIDGAGRLVQIFKMTIPMLTPTIIILLLMSIGKIFYGDFQMIYAIIGNTHIALYERLDVIETYLFRMVTGATPDYGVAGAIGFFQSALGFVMIFGSNTLVKLYNKDYALF